MAVALRGYTQGTTQADGDASIAWPAGTVAGDLAVLVSQDYSRSGPKTSTGWTRYGEGVYAKRVTSGDIAAALECWGRTTFLQTFSGAAGVGKLRWSEGVTLTVAGAGLFVNAWGPARITTITPGATNRLGNQIRLVTDDTPNAVWFRAGSAAGWLALTDHDDDCTYVSYELLPTAGPNAPVLVTPEAGSQVDTAAAVTLEWLHQSTSAGVQDAAKVRVRAVGAGTWSYVKTDGTLTATETARSGATQSATVNAGVLTTGTQYEWCVSTSEAAVYSSYSATQTFTPVAKPTVASITPTSPAGDLTPTIAWTMTAGVGSQEAWQVRICPSADATPDAPVWDSQVTSGSALSTSAPATTAWTNGATLYAWVRVQQTGGMWSAWTKDNATFTVSWTPPATPTSLTLSTATTPPKATLSSTAYRDGWELQWSRGMPIAWEPYHEQVQSGTASVYVYLPLAPYGTDSYFRARIFTIVDGVRIYSDWRDGSTELVSTDGGAYLVDDEDHTHYLAVDVLEDQARTLAQGVSVTYGLGADRPRVDRAAAAGEVGQTTLLTWTLADRQAVVTWLSERPVWWLRWSPERADATVDVPPTRMALAKPVGWQRQMQSDVSPRHVTFDWVEQ